MGALETEMTLSESVFDLLEYNMSRIARADAARSEEQEAIKAIEMFLYFHEKHFIFGCGSRNPEPGTVVAGEQVVTCV